MLRFTPIANARQAESYYAKSDGGYYLAAGELHCEWGGKGAELLGLSGPPDYEQFKRLIHGLDPHTGEQLTAKLIEERIPGWDVTASVPKGVTTALERGDARIRQALWEAGREAMADLEADGHDARPQGRPAGGPPDRQPALVRQGGRRDAAGQRGQDAGLGPAHPFRRLQPDPRCGRGRMEGGQVPPDHGPAEMVLAPLRPAAVAQAGRSWATRSKPNTRPTARAARRYYSWDIKGIPQSVITKFSRRSAEVEKAEQQALQAMKERDPEAPDELSPVARDKLGATSRLHKRDDLTLDDYRDYWNGRITPEEGQADRRDHPAGQAGTNPKPANTAR